MTLPASALACSYLLVFRCSGLQLQGVVPFLYLRQSISFAYVLALAEMHRSYRSRHPERQIDIFLRLNPARIGYDSGAADTFGDCSPDIGDAFLFPPLFTVSSAACQNVCYRGGSDCYRKSFEYTSHRIVQLFKPY